MDFGRIGIFKHSFMGHNFKLSGSIHIIETLPKSNLMGILSY